LIGVATFSLEYAVDEPVNALEIGLPAIMRESPNMNKETLASKIGKSRATVTRLIKSMVECGKIRRVGSDKTGHWEIVDK